MTIKKAYDSIINIGSYSVTTEKVTPTPIFVDSITLTNEEDIQRVDEIGLGSRDTRRMTFGNTTSYGSFTRSIDTTSSPWLYRYLMAGSATQSFFSGTSLVFEHTFSGERVNSRLKELFLEVSVGGEESETRYWEGGVVESYSLNISQGSIPKETWGIKFQNHTDATNSITAASLTSEGQIQYRNASISLGVSITSVSLTCMQDFTLNVNNDVFEYRHIGGVTPLSLTLGKQEVSGSFNIAFENYDLYNDFVNNTYTAIQIRLDSPSKVTDGITHHIRFDLPQCYFQGSHPTVDGPSSLIVQPINFIASFNNDLGYKMRIVTVSSQVTYFPFLDSY